MIVQIGRREEFDKKLLGEMHKLRAQVFKERKGWDVSVIDEMEIDGYDALSPYYMLIQKILLKPRFSVAGEFSIPLAPTC